MTKRNKLAGKFFRRPASISYRKLEIILISYGFSLIEAGGSHKKFKHKGLSSDLIIPVHNGDCKDFYKDLAAKIIKKHLT